MRKFALFARRHRSGLAFAAAAPAQAQGPRVWVSGTGDDGSPTCSRTAPCRTFAIALSRDGPRRRDQLSRCRRVRPGRHQRFAHHLMRGRDRRHSGRQ